MYYNQIIQNIETSKSIDDLFLNFNIEINHYMDCGLEHRKQIFSKLFRRFSQQKMIDSFLLYPSLFFIFFENKKDKIFNYNISNEYLKILISALKQHQETLILFRLQENLTFKILCFANESDSSLAQLIIRYIKKEYVSMDEIDSLFSFHILENDFNNIFFKYFNSIIIRDFLIFKGFKDPKIAQKIIDYKNLKDNLAHF